MIYKMFSLTHILYKFLLLPFINYIYVYTVYIIYVTVIHIYVCKIFRMCYVYTKNIVHCSYLPLRILANIHFFIIFILYERKKIRQIHTFLLFKLEDS